ncbi:MAG TPA: LytR C-terminal domain-containing protein, partial [Gaiellaceae bacterium]|nr:LytR C-terminal domain-containing protein [Gaiellaceae bacterium]
MSVVAAIEFVGLAAFGVALVGNPLSNHLEGRAAAAAAPPARTSSPRPRASDAKLPRGETSVIVLNGGGRAGAAAAEAQLVRRRGYVVSSVGNATRTDYTNTLVMYRPGLGAEGARLARDLHIRSVAPLDGMRVSQLAGAHLVVVLGR